MEKDKQTITPTELRALDLEMAELMGYSEYLASDFHPTVSPADAMMVLKKILLKRGVAINQLMNTYYINENAKPKGKLMAGPSLELAICLFAREVGR